MTAQLRPMNLGEILDRTFQIYRARFFVFVGIAAVPALAMLVVQLADAFWLETSLPVHPSPGVVLLWNYAVWLGFNQIASFLNLLISPASVYVTSTTNLGERVSVRMALSFVAERWRSYLWTTTLKLTAEIMIPEILSVALSLAAVLIAIIGGGLKYHGHAELSAVLLVYGLSAIAGCIAFFFLGSGLSLALPVSALEGTSGFKALRRSWSLSKRSRARIMVTWVSVFILSWAPMYAAELAIRWLFILLCRGHAFGAETQHLYFASVYLVFAMVSALLGPIYPIALTLFYYDQRIRHEGYDIEQMMVAAALNPTATLPGDDAPVARAVPEGGQA